MSARKIIKDDLRFLLFAEVYQRFSEPKTKRKAFGIVEAAIQAFDKRGFEHVTLEMIAREAGVTRPLLRHYFKDLDEIRDFALKYIRLLLQKIAVDAMSRETTPNAMMVAYVQSCFYWATHFKVHMRVWLGFLSSCSRRQRDRVLNTAAVAAGTDRIVELIHAGKASKQFDCRDERLAARLIQISILGALVTLAAEDVEDVDTIASMVKQQCLTLVGSQVK